MNDAVWRILLVDDDADLLEILKGGLEDRGCQVEVASDGAEGAEKAAQSQFDAIVSDLNMPRMNGLQLALAIKSGSINSTTPLFLLSGAVGEGEVEKATALNIVTMIPKPIDIDTLHSTIAARLGDKHYQGSLDPKVAGCFIQALSTLIRHYLGAAPTFGALNLHRGPTAGATMTGLVAFVGANYAGFVGCSFDQFFLKRLGAALFLRSDIRMNEALEADLVSEIVNQLMGLAKTNLTALNIEVAIGIPKVILGVGHKIAHRATGAVARFAFELDGGAGFLDYNLFGRRGG